MKRSLLFCTLSIATSLNAIEGKWWNRPLLNNKQVQEEPTCCCECEDDCSSECIFTAGGEWIYLSPREPDLEYARIIDDAGGRRKCFQWDFSSGWEIFASFQQKSCDGCSAWDLRGSYTAFKHSKSNCVHVSGSQFIFPLIGFVPNSGTHRFSDTEAKNCIDYQNAAGEFGWSIFSGCPFTFRMFAGVEYASIDEKFEVKYSGLNSVTAVEMQPKMNGVGPRLGFNGYWDAYCGFGIVGKFSTALLVSTLKGNFCQDGDEFAWREKLCSSTELIPNLQAKLGLTWRTRCFDCFTVAIEGGYQAVYYFRPLQRLKVTNVGATNEPIPITSTRSEDFGLDGYFINGSISF